MARLVVAKKFKDGIHSHDWKQVKYEIRMTWGK